MEKKDGWIKLYRQLLQNDLIKDFTALGIFIWCLLKANRQGKFITGRYSGSKELNLKPSTFWDALKRLEKKYNVLKLFSPTGRYTVVLILNWFKYQMIDNRPVGVVLNQTIGNRCVKPTLYKIYNNNNKKGDLNKIIKIGNRDFTLKDLERKFNIDTTEGRYRGGFEDWLDVFKRAWVTR